MATPVQYIEQTLDLYNSLGYPPYQWFNADSPAPWSELSKPLNQSRLGMLSTAGTYISGQVSLLLQGRHLCTQDSGRY